MLPELRLVRYFVAVAEERNFTRAAERLHLAQPALSTAVRQLEEQLGTRLLDRTSRQVELTPAGELLLSRGRELLADAERAFAEVREVERSPVGRVQLGLTPTARFGLTPELARACATGAPGVMLYTREDTTGVLLRDVRDRRLDLAVTFCLDAVPDGLEAAVLREEPAVVHLRSDHPLAGRDALGLNDLRGQPLLVAGGAESDGFTARVLALCREAGFEPRTVADPFPDLGTQAVAEGLGVVVYVRTAYPPELGATTLVPLRPQVTLPFHLVWRADLRGGAVLAAREALLRA